MALSVVYTVVNGVVYSEDRGGTVTDYRPDTLGSTAALTQGNTVTATYVYWPYGEVRAKTGSGTTNFTYVGTLGYYNDTSLRTYVRARHYRQKAGRWMTVDPYYSTGSVDQYYVTGNPVQFTDPMGTIPVLCLAALACLGIAALGLLLSCLGKPNLANCIKCHISKNPWLVAVAIACAAVLAICLGEWILGLLRGVAVAPKPIPVGALASGVVNIPNELGDPDPSLLGHCCSRCTDWCSIFISLPMGTSTFLICYDGCLAACLSGDCDSAYYPWD